MTRVIDPVCGMEIDREKTAIQSKFEGRTYFFCSTTCAREFDKNPRATQNAPDLTRGDC